MIRWQLNYHLTKWLLVVGLLVTVLILIACGRSTTLPLQQDKIAFISDRDGNMEIYVMDADGSNPTNLTNDSGWDFLPVWSPDGSKIAFASQRDVGPNEIYVMDADGSNLTNITNSPANDVLPAWSPDGSKIAFVSNRDGNNEIYVMSADGSNPTNLTDNPAMDGVGVILVPQALAWSPDSSKIAFLSYHNGTGEIYEIYVMDADGSNPTNLSNNGGSDLLPAWSPDGSKIAFISDRDGNPEIYVMSADGSNPTNLTDSPAGVVFLAWSPDGSRIALVSNRDGNKEIYVMDADGSNPINITNNPADDGIVDLVFFPELVWSPGGSRIAFVSDRDGNPEIYVMDADGSNPINLTNNPAEDHFPTWSP